MNGNPHQTHILVIDEQRSEREKLEKELHEVGFDYRMSSCLGEAEALKSQLMKDATVDVVLCPYSLQGTNALKLLRVIRDTGSEVPVILLALDLAEDIAIELLSAGMEDYIQRSSMKRLPVVIRKALQRHFIAKELEISRQKVHSSEMALRSMVRNMPMPVVMLDRELRFIVASDLWLKLSGNERDDLAGRPYHDLIPDQPEHWKKVQQQALNGEAFVNEGERFTYLGKDYWTRWKMNPWYDSEGEVGGLVIFSEDITKDRELQLSLERSEASLKDAQQLANMGSWEWEVGTPAAWASEELHRQFGHGGPAGPVDLAEVLSRVHPEDREVMLRHMVSDNNLAETAIFEFRYKAPSGQECILVSRTVVASNGEGAPLKLRGILQDVSKERLQEREKQESRRLLDNIFASVPDAMIYTDGNHMIQWASDSVQKVLGYRPDELMGLSIANLFYNVEHYLQTVEEVLRNGQENRPYIAKRRYRKKGGEVFHAETIGVMIKRPDGSLQGFLTSTRDISERNEVEERLRASEQLFRDMADNITEVFWLTDYQANRVLYMSPQYERLFGMPVQSIYDAPASWATHIHPEDRPGVVERFKHDASLGTYDVEYRILLPDGQLFWVRDKAFPIRDENGVVLRIAGISKDITAEKLGQA